MPPSEVEVCADQWHAVKAAGMLFDLTKPQQDVLELTNFAYLDLLSQGADYVEMYECRCHNAAIHYRSVSRKVLA
jgi:hypothetical protein